RNRGLCVYNQGARVCLGLDQARSNLATCQANPNPANVRLAPVANPVWELATQTRTYSPRLGYPGGTVTESPFKHRPTAPDCGEVMTRVTWPLDLELGRKDDVGYRIRVFDSSSTAHISVDDLWVTNQASVPSPAPPPIVGFADLHAHLMNEKGTIAYDGNG